MNNTSITNSKNKATPESKAFRRLLASLRIWDWYYLVVAISYVLTVYISAVRPGVFASCMLILTAACAFFTVMNERKMTLPEGAAFKDVFASVMKDANLCDALMAAFVVYNLLSVIWLTISGMPLYVYTGELATFILPGVFYIVGRMKGTAKGFYSGYLYGLFVLCAVGLIFYITAPQNYLNYLYDWSYISVADAPTMRVRMNSVCGSTILGSMSAAGMLAGAALFVNEKKRALGITGFVAGFIFAVLSNQRSAMVVAILIAVYMNVLIFFVFKTLKKKYFYMECGTVIVAVLAVAVIAPGVLAKVGARLISLPKAIGERSEQWVAAVNLMFSSWIGNGLGANGHRAIGIEGAKVVADGGLVKLFCENGVIGFSIFLFLLILLFKKGMPVIEKCFAELGIIFIFLLQSIGSNVLSFQLVAPIFWYAVGRCVLTVYKKATSCGRFDEEKGTMQYVTSDRTAGDKNASVPKIMCMYLPQYHAFPENDEWWGKGYTEWVAVKRAKPLFKGHIQPKEPADGNYYDLAKDAAATFTKQAELAKEYGVYGFAIYQYYFKGKKLMDTPLEELLAHPEIDLRYNLCWANESWTRTWYGLENQVLMLQEYGNESDWREQFDYLLRFFKDPRYIKVDNKPVYQIYKTFDIPCFEQMAECFNRWAKEAGYDGIYFISAKTAAGCEERSECKRLIDGYYYFEPGFSLKFGISPAKKFAYNVSVAVNSAINKLIKDENKKRLERRIPAEWIYSAIQEHTYEKDEFPGLIPDWDNTPRRSYKGLIYKGTSPKRFGEVLRSLIEKTRTKETAGENTENAVLEDAPGFIYINAWNEWGEGAYIEPDKYRGEEYLRKIKENVNC